MRSRLVAIAVAAALGFGGVPDPAAFPGANGLLVFETSGSELEVMDGDGMARRPLGIFGVQPAWSADGQQIVFARGVPSGFDVWVVDADGAEERLVSRNAVQPAWSPDGLWIAFTPARPVGTRDIWLMRSDGTRRHRITTHRGSELLPAWSPDGRRIAYVGQHHCRALRRCNFAIYVMDADGSKRRRLTRTKTDNAAPSWSPDGRWVVFVRFGGVGDAIAVVRADGRGFRRITPFREDQYFPVWSPDGQWIVYQRDGDLWRMRPDGKENLNLTQTPADEGHPDWAPARAVAPSR